MVLAEHGEGEEQAGGRQVAGVVAEIAFVDGQRRFAVEFVENIAGTARDLARRAEGFPTTKGTMAKAQGVTAEADPDDGIVGHALAAQGKGLTEGAAIAGQAAGDRNVRTDDAAHAIDQRTAVDLHPGSENQHRFQVHRSNLPAKAFAGGKGVVHALQASAAASQGGLVKAHRSQRAGAIVDAVSSNFAGRGTAQ